MTTFTPQLAGAVRDILARKVKSKSGEADTTCSCCGYALVELPMPVSLLRPRPMGVLTRLTMTHAHLAGDEGGDGTCIYPEPVICRHGAALRMTEDGVPECHEPVAPESEFCSAHQDEE
ncbi:hypothetical protein [Streptomyces sp. TR02-1]|uniref:hypothetical protein n=1 Tax=Streptomyces sp. TR02-1 TaxID=3385977 RepID=UPI0039A2403C